MLERADERVWHGCWLKIFSFICFLSVQVQSILSDRIICASLRKSEMPQDVLHVHFFGETLVCKQGNVEMAQNWKLLLPWTLIPWTYRRAVCMSQLSSSTSWGTQRQFLGKRTQTTQS